MIEKLTTLNELPVYVWQPGDALQPNKIPYVGWSYEFEERPLLEDFARLLETEGAEFLQGIVVGPYGNYDADPNGMALALIAAAPRLSHLRAIFLGDYEQEEMEISWIRHGDLTPLLRAFPQLTHLGVRGADGLRFTQLAHANLQHLTLQTGGLPARVTLDILEADLPSLTHLELWLGTPDYQGDTSVELLRPLLQGERFPNLEYLGLRNSEIADEIAIGLAEGALLERLQILDLSLGNLSDTGGEALLANVHLEDLYLLDLHHHFLSEALEQRFADLSLTVDLTEWFRAKANDEDPQRFIAVTE